jgi:phosphoribosylaminoimidazolecarboxamide formyltransferase/IMP cyclohydrolase
MSDPAIERAIISVSNKQGIIEFSQALVASGVELLSTGGTKRHLQDAGIAVRDISAYTGFPEMMDGRLKTLHPKVHGGILARHNRPDDMEALTQYEMLVIPLVIVNLYPFEDTVADGEATVELAIENIDIGGPTMIRGAAKNHEYTTIVTDPTQYAEVLGQVQRAGSTTLEFRQRLAAAAFARTARYDRAIAEYFSSTFMDTKIKSVLPDRLDLSLECKAVLRYGENPHQEARLYRHPNLVGPCLVDAVQINGKELSYNNLLDLDRALAIVRMLPASAAVVVKHHNPCGASSAASLVTAARNAFAGDPQSAFGSALGFNQTVDEPTAEFLAEPDNFIEAIVAPSFSPAAVKILTTRPKWKNNVRLMEVGCLDHQHYNRMEYRHIEGGLLVQEIDSDQDNYNEWSVVTDCKPSESQLQDLRFAWMVVRHVKSNAIVLSKNETLLGTGAGQMSRIDAVDLALHKAAKRANGCVLASDAFFPFADSIDSAATNGVTAIVQPGGSRRDNEVIAACNRHQLPMIFTARRHFKH